MINLTFFTIPQAFEDEYDLIQRNAIKSWTLFNPEPDIFLLGNALDVASIANEFGLYHIPNIDQNASISEIAKWLDRLINNTILVYLNPCVILTKDFTNTIQEIYNNQDHFFLTGQYRTIQTEGVIDFNDSQWQHKLRVMADKQGMSQGQLQDNIYLIFNKQLLKQLFILNHNAEYTWEQQLFYAALRKYYPIIDGSPIITTFLQTPKSKWKVVDGLVIKGVPPDFELPSIVGEGNDYTFIEEKRQAFIASGQPYKLGVSIVIPVYNRKTMLAKTLAAITHQTYPASLIEVIVADDGSHDGVEKVIQKYKKHLSLKYVRQDDQGYRLSAVRNLGTREAKHDYIAILDCDMLPTPKYIELLMQYFHVTDKAALMGHRRFVCTDNLTDDQILENINVTLALPDVMPSDECDRPEKEGEPIVEHRLKGYKKDNNLKNSLFSFYAFYGCSAYPKKVIAEVGPFDEDFQAWGGEDTEMGYRIYNAGYYFIPVLEAIGLHQEPPAGKNETDRSEGRQVTRDLLAQKCPVPVFRQYQPDVIYEVPKVSIYIPAYNAEKYIKAAVDSALAQTYTDLEICIVNDGSTDNTLQILEQNYQRNPRVRWINQKNGGIANASNVAVRMCRGMYIGQLDSDDVLLRPDAVEIMVKYLDTHYVGVVYSSCNMIDEEGVYIEKGYEWPRFSRERFMNDMIVQHFRMYRKRDWMRTSGFDESMESAVDFDMFLKLSEICSFYHTRKILYGYRWHGENTSIVASEKQIKYHKIAVEKALTRMGMDKEWETYIPDPKMPKNIVFQKINENSLNQNCLM